MSLTTSTRRTKRRARIENFWLQRPVLVIGITVALCALAARRFTRARCDFDYNLMNMQSRGPAVGGVRAKIDSCGQVNRWPARLWPRIWTQADRVERKAQNAYQHRGGRRTADGMLEDFIEQNQIQKLDLIGDIKEAVAPLAFSTPDMSPVDISEFQPNALSHSRLSPAMPWMIKMCDNDPTLTQQFAALQQGHRWTCAKTMLAGDTNAAASACEQAGGVPAGVV